MRWPWQKEPAPAARVTKFGVVGMELQCETCGVPTDAVQCVKTEPGVAWIRVDPCGHVISLPYSLE